MMHLIWIAIGFIGLVFVLGPFVTRITHQFRTNIPMETVELVELEPATRAYFEMAAPGLAKLGFVCGAYVRLGGMVPGVNAAIALWVNRSSGDMASLVSTNTGIERTLTLAFDTEFADGTRIETHNWNSAGCHARVAGVYKLIIFEKQDVQQLYEIHRARVERLRPRGSAVVTLEPGQELQTLRKDSINSMEQQVKAGRYYFDAQRDCYRPTLRGAFLMSWSLTWPVSMMRKWLRRREARQAIEDARAGGDATMNGT